MLLSLIAARSLTQELSTNGDSEVSNPPLSPNPARRSAQVLSIDGDEVSDPTLGNNQTRRLAQDLSINGDEVSDLPLSLNQLRRLAQDYSINDEVTNPPSRTVIDTAASPTLAVPILTASHIYVSFYHSEDGPRERLVEYRYDQDQDRYVMYSPPSPQDSLPSVRDPPPTPHVMHQSPNFLRMHHFPDFSLESLIPTQEQRASNSPLDGFV